MLSHRHIEVFRALMRAGTVTGAAALLHSSQPTLSRELARAEQLLGYALFERERGRLKPTQRALALFDEVQRAYLGLERVQARAQALARGDDGALELLSLPAFSHALLPGACARLPPAVALNITPQEPPLLEEWLAAQRFDLGLTEQALNDAGLQQECLMRADEVCILPATHRLASRAYLQPDDFAGEEFLSLGSEDPYRLALDRVFADRGVQRRLRLQTHSAVALCAMVQAGLGLSIVNPLTALASSGAGLVWRRFSVSVPYEVWLHKPLYRPAHGQAEAMAVALRAEAAALLDRLA